MKTINYRSLPSPKGEGAGGEVEFLIIGQGISGTWLSYYLNKLGHSFLVIDNNDKNASSRLAAGVINPVTGRRHVEVWKADEILPFAKNAYIEMGKLLDLTAISTKSLVDFFPSPQMRVSFMQRVEENNEYVSEFSTSGNYSDVFRFDFGAGEIKPVYIAHLETLLPAWRNELKQSNRLIEEDFDPSLVSFERNAANYKNITTSYIIFCDGQQGFSNPWFNKLSFAPNKGEILLVEIPGLPTDHIYKRGMVMVPLQQKDLWWVGSDYKWEFENNEPTAEFRQRTESLLKNWLKIPFKIVSHHAGIRPATIERRPFVGTHPLYSKIGILNGMGTKGCSLAPFFAKQLADHLCLNTALDAEASIDRFKRVLSK